MSAATIVNDVRPVSALRDQDVRYSFFTGKGGVGKTSLASATALALAESGSRTLLISTDPASNLDEVLGLELGREPRLVPDSNQLFALNIDPEAVAAAYREKVIGPIRGLLPEAALRAMEEQLSGACTMEIAAFDEFTSFLSSDAATDFDRIIFDTAPTGHTLRLMALSQAWTTFFDDNTTGNSCLGPLSGLEKQRQVYAQAVETLKDPSRARVVLVSRPQKAALKEARRTSQELRDLGIGNQSLAVNAWFKSRFEDDTLSQAWAQRQRDAVDAEREFIDSMPVYRAPLLPNNLVGLDALRAYWRETEAAPVTTDKSNELPPMAPLCALADRLVKQGRGVILTMGKGGVGRRKSVIWMKSSTNMRAAKFTASPGASRNRSGRMRCEAL